jgi:hypothetical protein
MNPSTLRRKILVLLLGSALVASTAVAADLRSPAFPRPLQLLSQGTSSLLGRLVSLLGNVWEKEGCSIDPYGLNGKNGCGLDPYGLSGNGQLQGEAGCSIDPYGLCVNGQSTGEAGGSADPYGGR